MEAQPAVGFVDARALLKLCRQWSFIPAVSLYGAIPCLLILRRLSGELHPPLSSFIYLASVVLFAAFAVGMRRAYAVTTARELTSPLRSAQAFNFLPVVGLILFVVAITLPDTAPAAIGSAVLMIFGVSADGLVAPSWVPRRRSSETNRIKSADVWDEHAPDLEEEEAIAEVGGDETILLRLTHGRAEEGGEFWHGIVRTKFVVGQRTAVAHVAFCPAFAAPPQITAWHLSGAAAEIRVTQSLPQGIRLEVRLSEPTSQPLQVVLEFTAHNSRPSSAGRDTPQHI